MLNPSLSARFWLTEEANRVTPVFMKPNGALDLTRPDVWPIRVMYTNRFEGERRARFIPVEFLRK